MRGRIVKQLFNPMILASALVVLAGCSGQQQQEENLETTDEEGMGNNLGQDDAAEGNGQENFVENDEAQQANLGQQDAETNSVIDDVGTEQLDATLENTGNAPVNDMAMANPAAMNPSAGAPAPMNAATPAPAPGGEGAPIPGGRVRYVREGGVQAVNAPGGQPVMMIEQGEHPVTWEENGYLRIANGVYVPVDAMSDQGIARPVTTGGWQ